MKRIFLSALGLLALLQSYSQQTPDSAYKKKRIKLEELNAISSYYHQNGNNAAVTGGTGTQQLSDFSNNFELKLSTESKPGIKHTLGLELGVDYYTSASSDMIDLKANTSASYSDIRVYPSVSYSRENEKTGTGISAGLSFSNEFDYQSRGLSLGFSKKTANRNGEFSVTLQSLFDAVSLIQPVELRTGSGGGSEHEHSYATTPRNTYSAAFSYSQIINERLQVMLLADIVRQDGYLSLPFHRVYFANNSVHQENLPGRRTKIPVAIRASLFATDNLILRGYYRYYTDDWGLHAHTAELEMPVKLSPFFSISPFYRYYNQTAVKYFQPYKVHTAADAYYTSNYDLSKFDSHFFGAGLKFTPLRGVLGIQRFNTLEIRYGHYTRSTDFNSNIVTVAVKLK